MRESVEKARIGVTGSPPRPEPISLLVHALESIAEAISVTDLADRFTFVNQAFLDTYGYTRDEILGQHVSLIWSPNNPPALHQEILDHTRAGGFKGELLNRAKDGREFPISLTTSHVRDETGRVLGLVGVAREITGPRRTEEAIAKRTRQLEAVRAISAEVTRELNLPALLDLTIRRAVELMGAASGAVFLWDEAAQVLLPQAWCGLGDWLREVRLRLGEGFVGAVAQNRQGMLVNDYRGSGYAHPIFLERTAITACLAEPLLYRDRLVGVIGVADDGQRPPFIEQDRETLGLLATQAAIAIENARLHGATVRRGEELAALLRATRSVMAGMDLRETLDRILEEASHIVGTPHVKVLLVDRETQALRLAALAGRPVKLLEGFQIPVGIGLSGIVAATGKPLYVPDCPNDPRNLYADQDRGLGLITYLGLPIMIRGEILGVLTFNTEEPRQYSPEQMAYLTSFADMAAIAIENARFHEAGQRELAERKKGEERLRALYQASLQIQEPLELRDRINRLLDTARNILHLDRLNVLLADPKGEWLRSVASLGTSEALDTIRVPIGPEGGGIARAYLTPQTITWDGHAPVPEDLRLRPPYDQIEAFRSRVFAIVPLVVQGRVIGVLGVDRKHSRGPLDDHTVELLHLFAAQAALAIENARLYAATERAAREARSLYEVSHSLTTSLEPGEVLHLIAEKTTELLGTPHAQVVLWDEKAGTLRLGAAYGTEAEQVKVQQFRLGEGLNGIVAQTRKPLIVNDYQAFAHRVPGLTELTADIGVPLLYRGRFLGVLNSHATKPGWIFTDEHLALLTSFADQAAVAIENARLYDAVQRHAAELEDRVKQRTAELEDALRVKALFLANMSHELRTPLNFVIGFSEFLRDGTAGPLTPKQAAYLDRIHTGGKRLLELVTHLLEVAETDSQPASFQLDRLVLNEVMEDVLAPLAPTAQAKSVALERALHPGLPFVVADRRKFTQILHHLVTNALRFTPTGGRVTVSARRVSTSKGEEAELAVQDTGIGIRPEDLERIFRPFEQVDGSDTRRYGGAGLGLALARQLTELHGGRIWAESEGEGRGARLIVRLPLLPAPPPPRILVVDDEESAREAVCAVLAAEGYAVDGASTGVEGLERVAAGLPNLLVLDIGLPDVDGRDLLTQLRADARTRDLPILTLSGIGSIQPEQILALGADEFLAKPVSPQVLSATVARLLRRHGRESRGEGTGMSAPAQDNTGSRS
jgi:PAS domain S-box-containing protein